MENVKVKLSKGAVMPGYKYDDDSGADIRCMTDHPITLAPLGRATVPTGIALQIPNGYEVQVRPRSGLAKNNGVVAMFGTIDRGYTGEICITVINLSDVKFTLEPGMRIAQIVMQKVEKMNFIEADKLVDTERSSNGFGSTGLGD